MATGKVKPKPKQDKKVQIHRKQVRIERVNPDNIRSVPVNDVLINHTETEFFITFSSLEPPTILDKQDLNDLKSALSITRAKLVVSPKFLEVLIKALNTNFDTFKNQGKK